MFRPISIAVMCLFSVAVSCPPGARSQSSQNDQSESKRKLVMKVMPSYPQLARHLALEGVVRVEAVVANDGTVKSVGIKGGHPVLAQAAVEAIRKWKWAPANHETTEPVEVKFDPSH